MLPRLTTNRIAMPPHALYHLALQASQPSESAGVARWEGWQPATTDSMRPRADYKDDESHEEPGYEPNRYHDGPDYKQEYDYGQYDPYPHKR